MLETWKFSELQWWPLWIIEKPSVRVAQTCFIKKTCQRQLRIWFIHYSSFSEISDANPQLFLYSVNYIFTLLFPPIRLEKCCFNFIVKYAKLIIVCKKGDKLWGGHLGSFFEIDAAYKALLSLWKKILKNILSVFVYLSGFLVIWGGRSSFEGANH